ncbi:mediator of RNA polymerase II transcription subunit 12-like [Musa acuminata AAA Group]|uniref:mediator of RNA polymerase II transcription subunit 12-like n=1 Tax=Musa acuminata AAA Group TaxID=214697 RepID=UPI0031D400A6
MQQRYSAASCGGGVSNSAVGGASSRENARVESSYSASNFSLNSRRQSQVPSYKLKCDKEPLNSRLGPPDFYPQTPNCPEETLTREYLQSGYKETVEGIEEAREIALTQGLSFSKFEHILKFKEALRKRLRVINESRAQKRKAGQAYGVPLSGQLLTKAGVFPEQKPCNEDARRRWIEALSQQNKQLRSLAEHVPHGYRRKALFEVLIRHNVPLIRAAWFIKVNYLNQVRPASTSVPSDKAQFARSDLLSKDVVEYLQQLLDEIFPKDGSNIPTPNKNQSSQSTMVVPYLTPQKNDSSSSTPDEEPSLDFKWWYMCHLVQWHLAEGLLLPSPIIEMIFNQLQEKESPEAFELLLPLLVDMIESVALSQTYVRMFMDLFVQKVQDPSSSILSSVDTSQKLSLVDAMVGVVRYLIVAVPDTFVALDCFPLSSNVVPDLRYRNTFLKLPECVDNVQFDTRDAYLRYLSCGYVVSSIQKRASNLSNIVNPSLQAHGAAKVLLALDRALITGNVMIAYNSLFEDLSDVAVEERWFAEISPCLRSSLKWIGTIGLSLICSIFFLCEWATCDYRNFRTSLPNDLKLTGRKDFSQIYFAVLLLKLKMEDLLSLTQSSDGNILLFGTSGKTSSDNDTLLDGAVVENVSVPRNNSRSLHDRKNKREIFQGPGPLHDIVVCWLDQHEIGKAGSFRCVEIFLVETIRNGIFFPHAYVRQLIASGIMDKNESLLDMERQRRHRRILQQLPGSCLFDVLEEARTTEVHLLYEFVHAYSNERRLLLRGLLGGKSNQSSSRGDVCSVFSMQKYIDSSSPGHAKTKDQITQLKVLISRFLRFSLPFAMPMETCPDDSQGISKRTPGSLESKVDLTEETPGCEECRKGKWQKLVDDRSSAPEGFSSSHSDDEDTWWVKKGSKSQESFKVELPLKPAKPASRGRQKTVRKTQSLAQLAAARIESSQGASTSHVCDSKVSCPHHRPVTDSEVPKEANQMISGNQSDIGKALKQLRLLERRSISIWLLKSIRQLVEGNEKAASKVSNCTDVYSVPQPDDRNAARWKLGEDEILFILYVLDISGDFISAIKFLIWLIPKVLCGPSIVVQGVRNAVFPKSREFQVCQVGEAFLFSSLQRYENVLRAADLLPEALTASIHRSLATITSNGRPYGSVAFAYARNLLKKYRDVTNVSKWEKSFRATCDQRMLAELDTGRSVDGEFMFSPGVSAGITDADEHIRQRMNGRMSRIGTNMKELVQRHVEEAVHYFYGKERKLFAAPTSRIHSPEKWDDVYQIAHDIVCGLVECIRQIGGASIEGDPSVVASAVSAIIGSIGLAVVKLPDFTTSSNYQAFPSSINSLNCVRHILQIHIASLCLLKDALGDRLNRVFEIALAAEASSAISTTCAPGKAHRNQFQLSPETNEIYQNHSNELLNNSTKLIVGKAAKAAAAISALVLGAIVRGVSSLDRMITAFRLKEGLDVLQFIRSARSSSNGISRTIGMMKLDYCIEVYVHWFRLLVGNCRTVFDGLVAEMLGESYILGLLRMQQLLPLNLVFPPAYSIFAMVIWRSYILNSNIASREDILLYQCFSTAIGDAIRHKPFREVFFQNTHGFYDLLTNDSDDSEFAAMLELHNPDKHLKTMAFVPLRARLFLNALIDGKMPAFTVAREDGSWVAGPAEPRSYAETEASLLDKLIHVLDTLQPAKFHWQWLELRLLLNEQALIEKIETHNMPFVEAIRSLSPNAENFALSESEKKFTEIILTRILARPEAAPLYSEVVHLLGKLLQESLVMDTKWILAGPDVLLGRKSIRQQLVSVAQRKGFPTKAQFWKPWGWPSSLSDLASNRGEKRKFEAICVEEGEVVDESIDVRKSSKVIHSMDAEGCSSSQQYITEKALAELILPCIDRSSNELRNLFTSELIKQMGAIDQQINTATSNGCKSSVNPEASSNKGSSRKVIRGGSPVLGRRPTDSAPPSAAALKTSLCLRLQFLLRLLPIIYEDRNMRQMLAPIILRLLGTRLIYEDADLCISPIHVDPSKREFESSSEVPLLNHSSDSLFDRLLAVLHGLLSSYKPSWLKPKPVSKSAHKSLRDFSPFDREVAESLQNVLDRMELPATIRRRIQAAMPLLVPSRPISAPCHLPTLSSAALTSLQPSTPSPGPHQRIIPSRASNSSSGRSKSLASQDLDMEIDLWTLLEDGTSSAPSMSSGSNMGGTSGDHSNLKACSWLKGTVRVQRTDLTYIGALDEDS